MPTPTSHGRWRPAAPHLALDALNAEARRWCTEVAAYRDWPQDRRRLDALRQAKRKARLHRGQGRLLGTVPAAQPLLVARATAPSRL